MRIQNIHGHEGINDATCRGLMSLIREMLVASWEDTHSCESGTNEESATHTGCEVSRLMTVWYQLAVRVMQFIAPIEEIKVPTQDLPTLESLNPAKAGKRAGLFDLKNAKADEV